MSTFIHGIASCAAIDTAGEIVDIHGLDITSLPRTGVLNYEHDQGKDAKGEAITIKLPASVVGKIIKAKKIFDAKDCLGEKELYFWLKIKLPFVYIVAELFDDYCDSARDCAGKFKYSKAHPEQQGIMGFSVEGSEIPGTREGKMIIKRSIGRKVTLTVSPANKACVAEILDNQSSQVKDDFEQLFKSEANAIQMFKSEQGSKKYTEFLAKKERDEPLVKAEKLCPLHKAKIDEGKSIDGKRIARKNRKEGGLPENFSLPTRAGSYIKEGDVNRAKVHHEQSLNRQRDINAHSTRDLGKSEAPSWSAGKVNGDSVHYNHPEHGTVSIQKQPAGDFHVKHQGKLAGLGGVKGSFKDAKQAGTHAKNYMQAISQKKIMAPKMQNISSDALLGKSVDLKKALTAGSTNAAPSTLVNGAAYQTESLAKPSKTGDHGFQGTKKNWNQRAKEDYENWPHREGFEKFMAARMPHLALGEIKAIGRALSLKKSCDMEKSLSELINKK